jgi:ribonuclease D
LSRELIDKKKEVERYQNWPRANVVSDELLWEFVVIPPTENGQTPETGLNAPLPT